jgi:hypothetical protein
MPPLAIHPWAGLTPEKGVVIERFKKAPKMVMPIMGA